MTTTPKAPLLIAIALIATVLLILALLKQLQRAPIEETNDKFQLTIQAAHLLTGAPVAGFSLEVINSRDEVVARQRVDDNGRAVFLLPADSYVIRPRSAYSGLIKVRLNKDLEVRLEVLLKLN